jgi:hypothetical protein
MGAITFLKPVAERYGRELDRAITMNPLPDIRTSPRLVFLSNSKANVNYLFEGVVERMRQRLGDMPIQFFDKGMSTRPVAQAMLEEIVLAGEVVLTASAD